tara:strand:+ start:242 stop:556 length:315 start_codon:yes stop_codon:yes gene_type:complete
MISYIKTENSFNKLLKKGTKHSEDITLLFTSSYDKFSQDLLGEIKKGNHNLEKELHVIDSFETPHAFVACSTTKVPCLVNIKNKKKEIEYHLPFIYEKLGVCLP